MQHHTLTYKIASDSGEMEQIYKLNYETFVKEIPQHQRNDSQRLVDKFDKENIYFIAKDGKEVVGMITVRAKRPFSLDQKLDNLDNYLPKRARPCEVRLLSIKEEYRKSSVFYKLIALLVNYCVEKSYNMALISGTDRQIRLYKRIGFEPFGPLVGTKDAMFQPMYLTKEKFETSTKAFRKLMEQHRNVSKGLNFLPGPVTMKKEVEKAFRRPAVSHRSTDFIKEMKTVREKLCKLVEAKNAQVVVGTGTLANDLVAAQIKKLSEKGLILSNGEFGSRLMDHADRMNLSYYKLDKKWNESITLKEIEYFLEAHHDIKWIWTVHCETSTGYLYELEQLQELTKRYLVKLCVDACSSVGVIPMSLKNVYLASTVSGKGIGSYPGLAIVFHQESIKPSEEIPRYLDLGQYEDKDSIPYTHSSNLLHALHEAVGCLDVRNKNKLANTMKEVIMRANIPFLGDESYSPGIITIPLSNALSSKVVGDELKKKGIISSYESDYLVKRNWIQFAFMGDITLTDFEIAISELQKIINKKTKKV